MSNENVNQVIMDEFEDEVIDETKPSFKERVASIANSKVAKTICKVGQYALAFTVGAVVGGIAISSKNDPVCDCVVESCNNETDSQEE